MASPAEIAAELARLLPEEIRLSPPQATRSTLTNRLVKICSRQNSSRAKVDQNLSCPYFPHTTCSFTAGEVCTDLA